MKEFSPSQRNKNKKKNKRTLESRASMFKIKRNEMHYYF